MQLKNQEVAGKLRRLLDKHIMEHLLLPADEPVITFDLSKFLNENTTEMEQVDSDDIPDEVLKELLDNNEENFNDEASEMSNCSDAKTPNRSTPLQANHFRNITKSDVDDIATKSCKKNNTQTNCLGSKSLQR